MNGRDDSVDAGEELLGQPAPSGRRRVGYALAAVLVAAGVIAGVLTRGHSGQHQAQPSPLPSPPASGSRPQPAPSTTVLDPIVRTASLPDLGSVQLFARAADAVIRLDFAAHLVITTAVPALRSSGPVTFGVTDTGAYVRPIDAVPGYFVPNGARAQELAGALAEAAVLPGPDLESVWVERSRAGHLTALRAVHMPTSETTPTVLTVPAADGPYWAPPQADGSGYVLVSGAHGTFDLRPDGAHRLPVDLLSGLVLASGSDRLLVASCAPARQRSCPVSLVRLPDGASTRVGSLPVTGALPSGVISPDRRTALIYVPAASGRVAAQLIDLSTGRSRGAAVAVDPDTQPGSAAYSADGRWAFLVGTGGTLVVLDTRTGAARTIDAHLPSLAQLATTAGRVTFAHSTVRMYLQTHSYERIGACSSPRPTTPTSSSSVIRSRC